MNLVLIGYRGAGKSTLGRELAARWGRKFFDTDDLLEKRAGASIREIVAARGWEYFRAMEKEIIAEISREEQAVIAPGGGAVLAAENVAALQRNGLIVWLKGDAQTLWQRISRDPRSLPSRPPLTGKGTREEFAEVLAGRTPLYEKAARAVVDTTDLSLREVLEKIFSVIGPGLTAAPE